MLSSLRSSLKCFQRDVLSRSESRVFTPSLQLPLPECLDGSSSNLTEAAFPLEACDTDDTANIQEVITEGSDLTGEQETTVTVCQPCAAAVKRQHIALVCLPNYYHH